MHFAALSQVGESMQKPGLYWQNNVMVWLNLIQVAVDHGRMDFVFSFTCATYGDQDNVVLDVDVCDLVDAHVLGLKCMQSWRGSRVFNLGTGDRFSVRQLIDQTKHVTNRPVPVAQVARRPGDCAKLVSGSLRAKTELGRLFDRSNLKQMITVAWRWHKSVGYTK